MIIIITIMINMVIINISFFNNRDSNLWAWHFYDTSELWGYLLCMYTEHSLYYSRIYTVCLSHSSLEYSNLFAQSYVILFYQIYDGLVAYNVSLVSMACFSKEA